MRTLEDSRWAAVLARDPAADFVYSVKTTGVYCRPSCAARRPNPRNVRFHASPADAERAGFRPCKRCRPDRPDPRAAAIGDACRAIEAAETPPTLDALARRAGWSPHHFHRVFKAVTGVTPAEFAAAHRSRRARAALRESASVTEAIYRAGYSSSGRFYE